MQNTEKTMEKIVALCKGRGFVFPGSDIYGGLANTWDYGPLGVELKNNVKRAWWKKFVQENPYNVEILELEAAQVPRVKDEVAYVVLNGNYALDAGFSVAKDSLAYEKSDSDAAKTYVNVIAVKEGNENSEKILALVGALKSDAIRQYINDTYDGAVVPFDD